MIWYCGLAWATKCIQVFYLIFVESQLLCIICHIDWYGWQLLCPQNIICAKSVWLSSIPISLQLNNHISHISSSSTHFIHVITLQSVFISGDPWYVQSRHTTFSFVHHQLFRAKENSTRNILSTVMISEVNENNIGYRHTVMDIIYY